MSSKYDTLDGVISKVAHAYLNSSLMISLGAGALKVSGGPKASSREEVSMATLEAGTTQQQPLTGTVTLNNFSGDTYL